jgi:hypothetical protein
MILANIDIFEMNYEEEISYFKCLNNLEKICCTNGLALSTSAVDNKKAITSSVGVGKTKIPSKMWCHSCDKSFHNTANCKAIAKAKQFKNGHFESKTVPGKKLLAF